jgi:hypothetical protein
MFMRHFPPGRGLLEAASFRDLSRREINDGMIAAVAEDERDHDIPTTHLVADRVCSGNHHYTLIRDMLVEAGSWPHISGILVAYCAKLSKSSVEATLWAYTLHRALTAGKAKDPEYLLFQANFWTDWFDGGMPDDAALEAAWRQHSSWVLNTEQWPVVPKTVYN